MTTTLADPSVPPAPTPPAARPRSRTEKIAVAVLLLVTAGLYLWNLDVSGWANAFYSGAVRAMTENWTAFFFGSTDAGNTVTVDKPPASLWVMALSARMFGLSSWSVLAPQALMGVGSVALLHAAVRRVSGPVPALIGGFLFALTPVVVLMFRFNNPDALLVLLMLGAAYAVVRAIEGANTRWLLLAGALVGFAFLTKTAQALLPLPALALAYLWAAPTGLWRRIRQLLAAGVAAVVAAGWWFLLAALWPSNSAPYIGGSTDGSAWQLAIGYNGLGRLFGQQMGGGAADAGAGGAAAEGLPGGPGGSGGGGPGGPGGGMGAGLLRMFGQSVGGQVAWAMPAALLLLVAGVLVTRRAARTDPIRASLLLWGGWTVVTGLTFSLMQGVFHEYYTVALAPGIAATVGVGGAALWDRRRTLLGRVALAVVVAATGVWVWVLLGRTPDFVPWLGWVVVALAVVAVIAVLTFGRGGRRAAIVAVAAGFAIVSLGPAAYASQTVQTSYTFGIPTAGPASTAGPGGIAGGAGGLPNGTPAGGGSGPAGGPTGPAGRGGMGSSDAEVGRELSGLLQKAGTKWSAATINTRSSASLALASGTDVMGIGGFTGADPAPTLAAFQKHVAAGEIHYFVVTTTGPGGAGPGPTDPSQGDQRQTGPGGGTGMGMGDSGTASQIRAWVQQHYTAAPVGGYTVYDLTRPAR